MVYALLLTVLTACGPQKTNSLGYQVQEFQFVNQDGKEISTSDLKGSVWLTDFVFTNCDSICPPMTANMAKVQQRLIKEELNIPIISFSVDPVRDTPEALKAFSDKYGANTKTWNFVTEYSQAEIEKFALESFRTLVQMPTDSDQVIHGSSFYLVDETGIVIKSYDGVDLAPLDEFVKDIKSIQK
jgi:protein SCO1/2